MIEGKEHNLEYYYILTGVLLHTYWSTITYLLNVFYPLFQWLHLFEAIMSSNPKPQIFQFNHRYILKLFGRFLFNHFSTWNHFYISFDFFFSETPSEVACRTLKLIAKALQNLANLVEFGIKVRYALWFSMLY